MYKSLNKKSCSCESFACFSTTSSRLVFKTIFNFSPQNLLHVTAHLQNLQFCNHCNYELKVVVNQTLLQISCKIYCNTSILTLNKNHNAIRNGIYYTHTNNDYIFAVGGNTRP